MIRYLDLEEIIGLLEKLLSETGAKLAFLNRTNLEFTLDSVRTKFGNELNNETMAKKAAYMMFQIVSSHPLVDGNKRTAAFLGELFIRKNGLGLEVTDDEFFSELVDLASGRISEKDIRKWVHENIR
ncbi:MAG: type II toxin-antitoxin system death-on-curing family toxin [Candidatus Nitrosotalea sp.]|nr:type II toxin-antitoxin system death-on-curing family toxin [Candidatus Nitrosotalea sp.]